MTSEPQEIGSGKNLAARLPEVHLAVILCRVIESIEHHPAQLRNAVYELARIKLRKEVCRGHPPISSLEVRRLTLALESAIESVETIYSRQDELRSLRSLHRVIESSEIGWSEEIIKPREPLLIIDQPAAQAAQANHRPNGASLIVERLLHWSSVAPLLRGARSCAGGQRKSYSALLRTTRLSVLLCSCLIRKARAEEFTPAAFAIASGWRLVLVISGAQPTNATASVTIFLPTISRACARAASRPDLEDKVIMPDVLIQPHSASLQMMFYAGEQFPVECAPTGYFNGMRADQNSAGR